MSAPNKVLLIIGLVFLVAFLYQRYQDATRAAPPMPASTPTLAASLPTTTPTERPTPAPSETPTPTSVRQIAHITAEAYGAPESGASRAERFESKLALQIEKAVPWSNGADLAAAGTADGKAARAAYDDAVRASQGGARKGITRAQGLPEPPDELKNAVEALVIEDAGKSLAEAGDSARYQAYHDAFLDAFELNKAEAGDKPEPDSDGHIWLVDDYLKAHLDVPDSYRLEALWKPQLVNVNGTQAWRIKCRYHVKTRLGTGMTHFDFLTIRDGKVIAHKTDDAMTDSEN